MRQIIFIEGYNCSGKTTLAKGLCEKFGFKIHKNLDPEIIGKNFWTKERISNYWLGEILTTAKYGDKIVVDRSIVSWMYYNGIHSEFLYEFYKNLEDAQYIFICLNPSVKFVSDNYRFREHKINYRDQTLSELNSFASLYNVLQSDNIIEYKGNFPEGERFDIYNGNYKSKLCDDVYNDVLAKWNGYDSLLIREY